MNRPAATAETAPKAAGTSQPIFTVCKAEELTKGHCCTVAITDVEKLRTSWVHEECRNASPFYGDGLASTGHVAAVGVQNVADHALEDAES